MIPAITALYALCAKNCTCKPTEPPAIRNLSRNLYRGIKLGPENSPQFTKSVLTGNLARSVSNNTITIDWAKQLRLYKATRALQEVVKKQDTTSLILSAPKSKKSVEKQKPKLQFCQKSRIFGHPTVDCSPPSAATKRIRPSRQPNRWSIFPPQVINQPETKILPYY